MAALFCTIDTRTEVNAEGDYFPATRIMHFGELPASRHKSERLAFFACGCGLPRLARAPRSFWMRVLPSFRLYKCGRCGAKVLRTRLPSPSSPYPLVRTHKWPRRGLNAAPATMSPSIVMTPVVQLVVDPGGFNQSAIPDLAATLRRALGPRQAAGEPPVAQALQQTLTPELLLRAMRAVHTANQGHG
jgi:hypothetical protein